MVSKAPDMAVMRPAMATRHLRRAIRQNRTVYLWGAPGVGKSSLVAQAAASVPQFDVQELQIDTSEAAAIVHAADATATPDPETICSTSTPLIDVRACLLDAVDLRGIPIVSPDGQTIWCRPGFLPWSATGRVCLLLDELANATPLVQSACLQLVLDRRIGEHSLPPNVSIISASNRVEDRAGAGALIGSLANRFSCHILIEPTCADWQNWAIGAGVDPSIRAYLNWQPQFLHAYEPRRMANATPRSWAELSRLIGDMEAELEDGALSSDDFNEELQQVCMGAVGPSGSGYYSFRSIWSDLPDLDELFRDPTNIPIKRDPATAHAVVVATADRIRGKATKETLDAYATYHARVGREYSLEYCAFAFRDGAVSNPLILTKTHCPTGYAWATSHTEILSEINKK